MIGSVTALSSTSIRQNPCVSACQIALGKSAILIATISGIDPSNSGRLYTMHARCALASLNAPVVQRGLRYADPSNPNALESIRLLSSRL